MFASVKRCVDEYLAAHPLPGVRSDRVVCFDVTNRKIDGTCYLFFSEDETSPRMVAKAARTAAGKNVFLIEYGNLRKLQQIGMNADGPTTPAPLGSWEDGETLVTLQSALPGVLMKNTPGSRLFSPANATATLERVLDWWRMFQDRYGVRRVVLSGDVYEREVLAPVDLFRRRYRLEPDEDACLERRFRTDRHLLDAELPFMPRHGDFCAANLVLQDERVGVFDWEFPLDLHMPLFDLFLFFSSVRFPYSGRGGESSHFDSFREVYWGDSYFSAAVRTALLDVCRAFDIDENVLGELFLLAVIRMANMKYDGLIDSHDMKDETRDGIERTDERKAQTWAAFDGPDKDAPFARISGGAFQNLGHVVRHGLPSFGGNR